MNRVLLIDDDEGIYYLLMITFPHLEIHWTKNLFHGIQYCNVEKGFFDLVLLDMNGTHIDSVVDHIDKFNNEVILISSVSSPIDSDVKFWVKDVICDKLSKRFVE